MVYNSKRIVAKKENETVPDQSMTREGHSDHADYDRKVWWPECGHMKVFFIRSIPWDSAEFHLKMMVYRDMRSNVWRTGFRICRNWEIGRAHV